METPAELMRFESRIEQRTMEVGRDLYRRNVQPIVDGMPHVGSDGAPLTEGRTVDFTVKTQYGDVKLRGFCGRCRRTGEFEIPFKVRFCRGERFAMSPLLERKVVTTVCETGSFEKASRVCGEWGCGLSDDKAMDTVRRVGDACLDSDLPELCANAARGDDVLIVMMDGWMARFRGERWAEAEESRTGHVDWHESKSAVVFRLSQAVDVSDTRRTIVEKHVVIAPPETTPEAFGGMVEAAAKRMGMLRAKKTYVIMDGGTYLWNVFDLTFSALAEATLDYYHASQHLGVLADFLFAHEKDLAAKEKWLEARRHELKHEGAKSLMDALKEIELKKVRGREARKAVRRETAYFEKHEEHMDYPRNQKLGIPIGSGAMESQCSQNQNRFKRRGQFWSDDGFASFVKAYVRYANGELGCCYSRKAA